MTEWQWKVFIALCRVVLVIVKKFSISIEHDMKREERDQFANDIAWIEEAVEREF